MEAHLRLNLGVYCDDIVLVDSIAIATSRTIPDIYWNYAYVRNGEPFDDALLTTARSALKAAGRPPTLWQDSEQPIPEGWTIKSKEAWMWLGADKWSALTSQRPRSARSLAGVGSTEDENDLEIKAMATPSEDMQRVFEDAYSSGGAPGDVGYFQLPLEYGQAYLHGRVKLPTTVRHFSGYLHGQCVAIATVGLWNSVGGLYSVATLHGFRRKGLGRRLSYEATRWAMEHGATGVVLQTEADSAVESLYRDLGYKRTHVGVLLGSSES